MVQIDGMATVRRIDAPPSPAAISAATKTLRAVFASLAKRDRLSNDDLEALFEGVDDALRALPKRAWMLETLDRVVGRSKRRRHDSIFVLVALASAPGAEARLVGLLDHPSAEIRREVIQAIFGQRWTHLAPLLAARLDVETDPSCRNALVFACGELRTPETLAALLAAAERDLEKRSDERHRLLFHLRKHRAESARRYFEAVFAEASEKELKVLAAWGLAKLGPAPNAHAFLVEMLDDTRVVHVREGRMTGVEPGLSERAGQALADIHELPFRWGKGDVPKIKARLRRL